MTKKPTTGDYELRKRAEAEIVSNPAANEAAGDLDEKRLLHELQAHKIELEMQNDELKLINENLIAYQQYHQDIIKMTHAGYFRLDSDERFVDVNDAWLQMHGYDSAEEVLGRHFGIVQVDGESELALKHLAELKSGMPMPFGEFSSRRKDGSVGHHIFSAHPVSESGRIIGFEWFIIDISERIKAEKKLRLREEALAKSERFLKTIFDSDPECIKMLDMDCNLLMMNRAGLEMIQADSFEQVKGQCVCPLITEAYRDDFIALTKRVFQGNPGTLEFETIGLKGRHVWLETHAVPFRNELGEVVALLGITRDITERKRTEEILIHERNLSMDIINTQPAGIYRIRVFAPKTWEKDAWRSSKSSPHVFELASEPFCKILGTTVEAFKNNPGMVIDLIYPDDREGFARKNEEAAVNLEEFIWEGRLLIDGVIRWVHFQSLPRPLENGDVLWTGSLVDITNRIKAEEEKQLLEQQLQQTQRLESLGVLSGGIAHDFNNILAIIMGYCSLTKMDYETAENNIQEIEKAAERAGALCRQMLAYAGKAQLTKSRINIWMMVDEMVTMLKSTLPKNAVIKTDLPFNIPFLHGDESQISQVVMNLIINASEAIGKVPGEIDVSLAKTTILADSSEKDFNGKIIPPGKYVCLEVADKGCGMDEETKWHIFEPFYTTKFPGRGLGMSAVLGIINSHNGALQLFSQLGHGSTFKVYLPVPVNDSSGDELPSASTPSAPWQGSGTIILVEDEDQVRLIAKALLKKFGFTVLEAANGKEALELYQENAADILLVLTDLGMPVMDGYELFYELKKLNPELPIIVSSGYGDAEVRSRIGSDNIAGLISKPYNPVQLRDVLQSVLMPEEPK